ncbi:MAG: hypothetical protein LBT76_02505 [Tannerella sp.]|jgi:hypothetical protein|nr:hypothetical protein [Tannerella sp.]
MNNRDFVPTKESDFREWEGFLMAYIASRIGQWHIPEGHWMTLANAQEEYEMKYGLADNPATRTPAAILDKHESRRAFVALLRPFLASYVTSGLDVTDADRVNMGLPVHSKSHTHHPVTSLRPTVAASGAGAREVDMRFFQPDGSKAKPEHVTGILFAYTVSGTPVEDPNTPEETFSETAYFSKTAEKMYFAPEQSGQFLCGHACYTSLTGERGQFGNLICIRIP